MQSTAASGTPDLDFNVFLLEKQQVAFEEQCFDLFILSVVQGNSSAYYPTFLSQAGHTEISITVWGFPKKHFLKLQQSFTYIRICHAHMLCLGMCMVFILVIQCCIANSPNAQWLKITTIFQSPGVPLMKNLGGALLGDSSAPHGIDQSHPGGPSWRMGWWHGSDDWKAGLCWDCWLEHMLFSMAFPGELDFLCAACPSPHLLLASIPGELSLHLGNHKTLLTLYVIWLKQSHSLPDAREKCRDLAAMSVSNTM